MGLEKRGATASHATLFFKLCSDHLSIEAIPRRAARIDLARLKGQSLPGLELMLWTPPFVVLRTREGYEVTLRRDGRMIIRKAPSEQAAQRTANDVMTLVAGLS
ncbi:MAG TPA: hypothetical protein VED86_06460 [archaeon]|nr:hypothetical protein [archaeon]